jgi:putative ABC transport system ATP-binding protein
MIRMSGISKTFFTDEVETRALSEVHLSIERGEFLSISGQSGSGKTTLLSILGLLDAPSAGARACATARSASSSRASTSSAS